MKRVALFPLVLFTALACSENQVTDPPGLGDGVAPGSYPVTGGVFTSTNPAVDDPDASIGSNHDLCANAKDANGPAINCNIYRSKSYVWLTGGPGPSDLADGLYMFAVLVPGGQGGGDNPNDCTEKNLSDDPASLAPCTSSNTGAGDTWQHRVFSVASGVISYPAATYPGGHDFENGMIRLMPYDDTENNGGEYTMAICNLHDASDLASAGSTPPGVDPSDCKYDNFKVRATTDEICIIPSECQGTLTIDKFYDSNGDGIKQNGEAIIAWQMLVDATTTITTPFSGSLAFGNHTVMEGIPATPANTFWYISHKDVDGTANQIAAPINLALATPGDLTANASSGVGQTTTVLFGDYCTIRPGGRTMGFWSNNNGAAIFGTAPVAMPGTPPAIMTGASDLTVLQGLRLRDRNQVQPPAINGLDFDPLSYTVPSPKNNPQTSGYRPWLLRASATNMAYMLSAQLSATVLNVRHGFTNPLVLVDGTSNVYDLISYANGLLTANGLTTASGAVRDEQGRVKNLLDKINNNGDLGDFIQADAASCGTRTPYTFVAVQN